MPKFKGKTFHLSRIAYCPICKKEPLLRKDSTKRFQLWCECGFKTGWTTKTQAVIDWYNLIFALRKYGDNMSDLMCEDDYSDDSDEVHPPLPHPAAPKTR